MRSRWAYLLLLLVLVVSSLATSACERAGREVPFAEDEEYKLTFPILLDETFEVNIWFGVRGIPTSFLIDQEGRVARVIYGARDWATPEARTIVRQLLPG